MSNVHMHFYLHGLIILIIGLVGGIPFAVAVRAENGREVAWRVVHTGASSAGAMIIAMGAMVCHLAMSERWNVIALVTQLVGAYTLVAGMVLAAFTGERGIGKPSASSVGKTRHSIRMLYSLGAFFQLCAAGIMLVACFRRLVGH